MDKNPYLPGSPDEFIENNLGLSHQVAQKFYLAAKYDDRIKFDREDFISIAYEGLIKAYMKFDPTKFVGQDGGTIKFSSYAIPMIKGEIWRQTRDTGYTIRKHRKLGIMDVDSLDRRIYNDIDEPITLLNCIVGDIIDESKIAANVFLSQMGPRLRKVYKLRNNGLSQEEIGKIMGVTQVSAGRMERYIYDCAEKWANGEDYIQRYNGELKAV